MAAPVKVLAGAATGLNNPQGIAVEPSGATFAVNYNASPQSMSAYAGDWQNGDTAPSKTLAGIATGIADPQDVANRLFFTSGVKMPLHIFAMR